MLIDQALITLINHKWWSINNLIIFYNKIEESLIFIKKRKLVYDNNNNIFYIKLFNWKAKLQDIWNLNQLKMYMMQIVLFNQIQKRIIKEQ